MEVASILVEPAQGPDAGYEGQIFSRGHLFFANGREYFEIGGLVLSAPDDAPLDQFGYRWPSQIVSFVSDRDLGLPEPQFA